MGRTARCSECARFNEEKQICAAFPKGIPCSVLHGDFDHSYPHPLDNGIQFERKAEDTVGSPDGDVVERQGDSHFREIKGHAVSLPGPDPDDAGKSKGPKVNAKSIEKVLTGKGHSPSKYIGFPPGNQEPHWTPGHRVRKSDFDGGYRIDHYPGRDHDLRGMGLLVNAKRRIKGYAQALSDAGIVTTTHRNEKEYPYLLAYTPESAKAGTKTPDDLDQPISPQTVFDTHFNGEMPNVFPQKHYDGSIQSLLEDKGHIPASISYDPDGQERHTSGFEYEHLPDGSVRVSYEPSVTKDSPYKVDPQEENDRLNAYKWTLLEMGMEPEFHSTKGGKPYLKVTPPEGSSWKNVPENAGELYRPEYHQGEEQNPDMNTKLDPNRSSKNDMGAGSKHQCHKCKHMSRDGDKKGKACAAFSDGIPNVILIGEHDHSNPYEGDNGTLFEPMEDVTVKHERGDCVGWFINLDGESTEVYSADGVDVSASGVDSTIQAGERAGWLLTRAGERYPVIAESDGSYCLGERARSFLGRVEDGDLDLDSEGVTEEKPVERVTKEKGSTEVIGSLNALLSEELAAINQYMAHSEMYSGWGHKKIGIETKKHAIGEMHHAESLIERIIYLSGVPEMGQVADVKIGSDPKGMIENDLASERNAVDKYNKAIEASSERSDNGTKLLLESILKDEESHVDDLQGKLDQIAHVGIENFLSTQ